MSRRTAASNRDMGYRGCGRSQQTQNVCFIVMLSVSKHDILKEASGQAVVSMACKKG